MLSFFIREHQDKGVCSSELTGISHFLSQADLHTHTHTNYFQGLLIWSIHPIWFSSDPQEQQKDR